MAPFLLNVVWHPDFEEGVGVAERLRDHFGSHRFRNVVGGAGVRVVFRSVSVFAPGAPIAVEWDDAEVVAAVVLVDRTLVSDPAWIDYVRDLSNEAEERGMTKRVFPVAMESSVLESGVAVQAVRWDTWADDVSERQRRLLRDLTHEFSRMLRLRLKGRQPTDKAGSITEYLRKIQVFLSHSKHDDHGVHVANSIRNWLHQNSALASFMDVHDIPPGLPFEAVFEDAIGTGVLVAIHTDSFSSREWCRREVLAAKRRNLPMVVVDCLQSVDERAFPYLGNVPVIRMNPERRDRLDQIADLLLDEVFKNFLWRCRIEPLRHVRQEASFHARSPELLSLANLSGGGEDAIQEIVHPGPPLGVEEKQLFAAIAPTVRLRALSEWLRENRV